MSQPDPPAGQGAKKAHHPPSNVAILALVVSLAGLLVSAANLYLTQLRKPRIELTTGPEISVYYPRDGGFGIYIPMAFVNPTARGLSVLRVRLVIQNQERSTFECEWANFSTRDPNTGNFLSIEAGPIGVPASSSVSKVVWFVWRPNSEPELILNPGEYTLRLLVWTSLSETPDIAAVRKISVDYGSAELLMNRRAASDPMTLNFTFHGMTPENRFADALE